MKLRIITVGKPKERFIREGIVEYVRRLSSSFPLDIRSLPDVRGGAPETAMEKTGRAILKELSPRDHAVLLDEAGDSMPSVRFSSHLFSTLESVSGRLVFVVGGPFGVSREVRQRSDEMLSLSPMTMTHEMCLLLLSEQIYRAWTIREGMSYHHG